MKFYRHKRDAISLITILIISDLFAILICFSQSDGWIIFLIYFLFCIFNIVISMRSDKIYIDSDGISCFTFNKRIFFCAWENIECFKSKYYAGERRIDIVPIDVSKVEIHNYQFTVSDPYFYFQLTRNTKKQENYPAVLPTRGINCPTVSQKGKIQTAGKKLGNL